LLLSRVCPKIPFVQRGYVYKHRGAWCLQYYDSTIVDGVAKRVRVATKLAPIGDDYPTKRSVLLLADKILAPLNAHQTQPESSLTVVFFIENYYLPHVEKTLRPSTLKDYKTDIFEKHLRARLGDIRLRDFRTVHGQRILQDIPEIGHTTRLRIKSFLSGAFKHALRQGFLDGYNPMQNVSAPGRPVKFRGAVYSMTEISEISELVGLTAFVVISVAAFAGLRLSELRGLRWEDYDGQSLQIVRSVWRTHVGPTKTDASAASVPVIPILKKTLDAHKERVNGQPGQYIFAGERKGTPLNLANLARRVIKPALQQYEGMFLEWKGWHAFRRSLATNLYACGVQPKIIQAILRHSDVSTTLGYYVQTQDTEARAALQKIEEWLQVV
jgi:integrase